LSGPRLLFAIFREMIRDTVSSPLFASLFNFLLRAVYLVGSCLAIYLLFACVCACRYMEPPPHRFQRLDEKRELDLISA